MLFTKTADQNADKRPANRENFLWVQISTIVLSVIHLKMSCINQQNILWLIIIKILILLLAETVIIV